MTDTTIAITILEQLGGSKFRAMTGASNFTGHRDALSFKLPSRFAKNGINYVKVTLTPKDLYDIQFGKIWRKTFQVIDTREDIYFDQLQEVFTRVTGLDTHL